MCIRDSSHTRGIISLNLPDMKLMPGDEQVFSWYIFSHKGGDDFRQKLLERESVWVSCNKYVFEKGETALVKISGGQMVKAVSYTHLVPHASVLPGGGGFHPWR